MAESSGNQLHGLVGAEVKINRGGPDSISGTLLGIQSDYMAVGSENGIVYINTSHVKSISQGTAGQTNYEGDYVEADNFNAVMKHLRHQYVQINRGGPEKLEGVISEVTDDFLLLVVKNEVIRIPLFHIKSINVIVVTSSKDGSDGKNKSGSSSKSDGKNKSDSKSNRSSHSSSSRSDGSHSRGSRSSSSRSRGSRSHSSRSSGSRSHGSRSHSSHSGGSRSGKSGSRHTSSKRSSKRTSSKRKSNKRRSHKRYGS